MTAAKSGSKGKIIALAGLAVILLAGAAWYIFLSSTPEKTVSIFMEALKQRDVKTAKAQLSAASDASDLTDEKLPADAKNIKFKVGKAAISGKFAEVPVTVTFPVPEAIAQSTGKQEITSTSPFGLIKEGGRWKIDEQETLRAEKR